MSYEFLNSFDVLNDDLSQKLYLLYLSAFKCEMDEKIYEKVAFYESKVFNMVENLRDMNQNFIIDIFNYLDKENAYIADLIIMMWCLPRSGIYLSSFMYDNVYRKLIDSHNKKMIDLINHKVVKNFCIETITKINNVPIHCIDYIWPYLQILTIEFDFNNNMMRKFIMIKNIDSDSVVIGIDMSYVVSLGLGKPSFENIVKQVMTDNDYLTCCTKDNYVSQKKRLINSGFITDV